MQNQFPRAPVTNSENPALPAHKVSTTKAWQVRSRLFPGIPAVDFLCLFVIRNREQSIVGNGHACPLAFDFAFELQQNPTYRIPFGPPVIPHAYIKNEVAVRSIAGSSVEYDCMLSS